MVEFIVKFFGIAVFTALIYVLASTLGGRSVAFMIGEMGITFAFIAGLIAFISAYRAVN